MSHKSTQKQMQLTPYTFRTKSNKIYSSLKESKGEIAPSTETALYTVKYAAHSLIIKN